MNANDIAAWQKKYSLSYHIPNLVEAERRVGLRDKNVLEIGGSLCRDLVIGDFAVKQWIAIEELEYYSESGVENKFLKPLSMEEVSNLYDLGDYAVLSGRAEKIPQAFFGQFDVVFSIAAFEHIDRLPAALERMHQALKPGGRLFAMFSPIWSAHDGHHLHGITDNQGRHFDFGHSPIPPWGHLLMRPPQMYRYLLDHVDTTTAAEIVYHVYNSPSINRLFTEDYVSYFKQSPFEVDYVIATYKSKIPNKVQEQLQMLFPGYHNFDNNGLMVVLHKEKN